MRDFEGDLCYVGFKPGFFFPTWGCDLVCSGVRRQYVFMDLTTYEETRLPKDDSWAKWLKEGAEVALVRWGVPPPSQPPFPLHITIT